MNFIEALKTARGKRSVDELMDEARTLNLPVSRSSLFRWEAGTVFPKPENLWIVVSLYGGEAEPIVKGYLNTLRERIKHEES